MLSALTNSIPTWSLNASPPPPAGTHEAAPPEPRAPAAHARRCFSINAARHILSDLAEYVKQEPGNF